MIFIQVDENETVSFIHYMPFDDVEGLGKSEDELLQEGFLVDSIPNPKQLDGKVCVTKYNQLEGFYFEYIDRPLTTEEKLNQLMVENEQLRLEIAQSNTELFEMMIAMSGGTA